jgi:serine protease Do
MEDVEREPCPRCGEPAPIGGRVCPRCQGTLLVDLVAAAIPDPRLRYRAARDLSRLGFPFPSLRSLQELLSTSESVVASEITRAMARNALQVLQANGGHGRAVAREEVARGVDVPLYEEAFRPSRLSGRLVFIVPVLLAGAALLLLLSRPRPRPVAAARAAPPSSATAAPPVHPTPAPREVIAKALESTASVVCFGSSGAGFFVAPDLLVTNDHVLRGNAPPEVVLHDGRRLRGEIRSRDDWLDLALVRVPGASARPLPLGDATRVAAGDAVLMIGNPVGMDFTVTPTIVSHAARNLFGIAFLQFDGNVNPGNSGGPLLDSAGRAIGIVSMLVKNAQGIGLALPVNYLYELHSAELPLPIPAPDFTAWEARLTRGRREEKREIETLRAAFRKPGLSGAAIGPTGEAFAILIARGMPSGAMPFSFDLVENERLLCRPTGIVESWDFWSRRREDPRQDARYLRWLEKAGLAGDLYVGTALLHMEACPDQVTLVGAQLILREAEPGLDRAVFRAMQEVR